MNTYEFEQFVRDNGKDILRFCRMTCGNQESGNELYQDTMLKLLEKRQRLDYKQNVRSYALSISILLWKNKKKKYANRNRLLPIESIDCPENEGNPMMADVATPSPESYILQEEVNKTLRQMVANLPEKYRTSIYLYYSANMSVREIAKILHIPEGTVKSRMNKARQLLKDKLEVSGYDR